MYPVEVAFRPLLSWPGQMTARRKRSQFKATYERTLLLLKDELRLLKATNIVIQIALNDRDIRRDGLPYDRARPLHPGIVLSFNSKHGALSYPCDTYDDWRDNLRAIALALENLRAVDRYGVTRRGEQYRGWTALPPPMITEPPMSIEQALAWLMEISGLKIKDGQTLDNAYRAAAKKTHPDRGGTAAEFNKTERAKRLLEKEWAPHL